MVLVSVIGDFDSSILPVFYNYAKDIKKHIIIYDDFKHDVIKAKNLIKGMKNFAKNHKLNIKFESTCIDEDSIDNILGVVNDIDKSIKNHKDLYINTTDGLSSLNTYFSMYFLKKGAKILSYDRFDNELTIITEKKVTNKKLLSIPIKKHFLLKNIKIEHIGNKKEVKKQKNHIINLFEKYYSSYLNLIKTQDFKKNQKVVKMLNELGYKNQDIINEIGMIIGSLFEKYLYLKLKEFNFDDIEFNIKVYQTISQNNDKLENEFDILLMKDNHLHIIEAKFKKIKLTDLMYKYSHLKNFVDDDGKVCVISKNKMKEIKDSYHYNRSLANNILFTNISNFEQDIKDFL